MSKATKIWLTVAAVLILVGGVLFAVTMMANGWDFARLSTVTYETKTYTITEDFTGVAVIADTADVTILPAENGKATVVCTTPKTQPHTPVVQDGTLTVTAEDNRAWHEYISVSFVSTKVAVYLPQEVLDTIAVTVSTGDVALEGLTGLKDVTLTCSTGDVTLRDLTCQNLSTTADTGDLAMTGVLVRQKMAVERSTGNVKLTGCDGGDITIRTSTGDVTGTLLTPKTFTAESDTGRVTVPDTLADQRCRVFTDTGDIEVTYVK